MRRLLAALALALALAAPAERARAHAQLLGAEPAAGATLAAAPDVVALRFDEPVAPLAVRWVAPDGSEPAVAVAAQGATVLVTPPGDLAAGTHLVSWRVVSADGHPVGGALAFGIGAAPGAAPASTAPSAALPAVLARFALTAALALGVGGAVFALVVDRGGGPGAGGLARAAAAAAAPLAALLVGAAGLDRLGAPPAALARLAPWRAGLDDPAAASAGAAALAAALALVALRRGSPALACAAWGAAALSFPLSGHAATAEPAALARGALAVHGAALVLWVGALPGLAAAAAGPGGAARLARFSPWGAGAVATLAASGATLAALQSGGLGALAASAYGALLGAKLALVLAMVALAGLNRLRMTPALAAGRAGAARAFRRSAAAEIALGLGAIALAAGFRLTPPPRALAAAQTPPLAIHLHGPTAMADLTLTPGRAGPNMIEIAAFRADFQPIAPLAVAVAFTAPGRGLEPQRLTATRRADGVWVAGPAALPFAGPWEARVDLLVTDFDKARLGATVILPP